MITQNYNGWTNYETWLVSLWLDNEEGSYNAVRDMARENDNARDLADALKSMHEEAMPETTGVFADLLNAAMSEVNWREIAEHYLGDLQEEVEA
jgi:hypothetical protein